MCYTVGRVCVCVCVCVVVTDSLTRRTTTRILVTNSFPPHLPPPTTPTQIRYLSKTLVYEEYKQYFDQFVEAGTLGNGKILLDDVKKGFRLCGILEDDIGDEILEENIKKHDVDESGCLDWHEFKALFVEMNAFGDDVVDTSDNDRDLTLVAELLAARQVTMDRCPSQLLGDAPITMADMPKLIQVRRTQQEGGWCARMASAAVH